MTPNKGHDFPSSKRRALHVGMSQSLTITATQRLLLSATAMAKTRTSATTARHKRNFINFTYNNYYVLLLPATTTTTETTAYDGCHYHCHGHRKPSKQKCRATPESAGLQAEKAKELCSRVEIRGSLGSRFGVVAPSPRRGQTPHLAKVGETWGWLLAGMAL